MSKIAIIGSGMSGISAAFYLKENGQDFDIIESSENIGGRVGSLKMGNKWIDFGGKNIGYGYKLFREFVAKQKTKFNYEYFGVNTSKLINKKVVKINREKNLKSIINLLKLANPIDLLKLLYLVKRIKKDPNEGLLNSDFYNKLSKKYDNKPLTEFFGNRCCKNIIRPMTVRMNAAEPEESYVGNFGSNLRIAFDKYDQIVEGMKGVLDCFYKELKNNSRINIIHSSKVTDLIINNQKIEGIRVERNGKTEILNYDKVIIATPANISSDITKSSCPALSQTLGKIKYNPLAILVAKYQEPVFDSETRAMVFDEKSTLSNAGAYGINDLDMVRYTFSGKAFRKRFSDKVKKADLIKEAESIMPNIFNIKNNKIKDSVLWYSDTALCSYSPFHFQNLKKISKESCSIKGLFLTGDYIKGASIESCFEASKETVNKLLSN